MLAGRTRELDVLTRALEAARTGRGSATVMCGEPGIGKSRLLDAVADMAGDAVLLRCAGTEAERTLPFSGLAELLYGHLDVVGTLAGTRANALRAALRLGPGRHDDRLAVFEATLDVIDHIRTRGVAVVLVDDLQWLDAGSADFIAYLARRLSSRNVALFASTRPGEAVVGHSRWADVIDIGALDEASARELLRRGWPDLSAATTTALVEASTGNPLALVELPTMLTPAQRCGTEPLPEALPLGPRLNEAFVTRLQRLAPTTRHLLLLLALARTSTAEAASAIAARSDLATDVTNALHAGLLVVVRGRLDFSHPLVRSAAVSVAGDDQIRGAHEQLAATLQGESAVWHRAACALGPDDAIAAELETIAADALSRSSPDVASKAYELAVHMSSATHRASELLLAAGSAAFTSGDATRAIRLLDESAASATDVDGRAAAEHLAGTTTLWYASAREGHRRLIDAARRPGLSQSTQAAMLADAALAATAWDCVRALELAREAWELASGASDATRAIVGTALMWCLTLRGQARESAAAFAIVEPLLGAVPLDSPSAQSLLFALNWRIETEDYQGALTLAGAIAQMAEAVGALAARSGPLIVSGDAARRLGMWSRSQTDLDEARNIALDTHQLGAEALASAMLARLHAARGDEDECHRAVADLEQCATTLGMDSATVFAGAALGLLDLGMERPERAVETLELTHARAVAIGLADPLFVPYLPDLIEALVRLGDTDRASMLTELLAQMCSGTDAAGARAALGRCEGLVQRDPDQFERALSAHEVSGMPFETARTLLVRGELARRNRRRSEARNCLFAALALFDSLGAAPWSARTGREIAALDGRDDESLLTNQQIRIAHAAAGGARNREIAAQMFVSTKTVERHLTEIYRLAKVRSRTELGAWLSGRGALAGTDAEVLPEAAAHE